MAVSTPQRGGFIRQNFLFSNRRGIPEGKAISSLVGGPLWAGYVTPIVLWLPVGKAGCVSPQIGLSSESSFQSFPSAWGSLELGL